MVSIEEKVEEQYKNVLSDLGIRHYGKTESVNDTIAKALKEAKSKSGNSGNNYPDIRIMIDDNHGRFLPVMIEAKGSKGKLVKLNKDGSIKGPVFDDKKQEMDYSAVVNYAVNGAIHYANAILDEGTYKEAIAIGINGVTVDEKGRVTDPECEAYYISIKNNRIPKKIASITATDWSLFKSENAEKLFSILDRLNLTEKELEDLTRKTEATLEEKIKAIHQSIYDNQSLKMALTTNEKLYLFCGLIMAGLKTDGIRPLEVSDFASNDNDRNNDGHLILRSIESFLGAKSCSQKKIEMILSLLDNVFKKKILWQPRNGESVLKVLFKQVKQDIIPCLESNLHLDFTGRILNSLNDWVSIDNDAANDVVLTPRYVTHLMSRLAKVDMNSYVWDACMGSGGFLVSAMDLMIKDAKERITDTKELEEKIRHIKENQLLGIEILGNIYILAVLNMILMGDGSSNVMNGDSHEFKLPDSFPAIVYLLNPPYSAPGKGLIFVEEALNQMTNGYGCILIQDSAGSGQGNPYAKRILQNNTLVASIKMPAGLFGNKASVSTYIFLFKVARPHEKDDLVTFIDFSEDGYSRQNRKKSSQEVNLRNTDHAVERYDEIVAIVHGKKPKTDYYTEENGKVIKDTISLNGDDWCIQGHQKVDTVPTEEDFKAVIGKYLSWKVSQLMGGNNA